MSRLEKNREEKQKKKQRSKLLFLVLAIILVLGTGSLLYGNMGGTSDEASVIDQERSVAYIDFFDITYVHVYPQDEAVLSKALVNGEALEEDPDRGRWSGSFLGYSEGEEMTVTVSAGDNGEQVQEEVLVIDEMAD